MTSISLSYAQLLGSYIVFNYLTHILSLLLFLLQFTDIRYYVIYAEKDKLNEICKNIEHEVYFSGYKYNNGRNSPGGHFIGWNCIGIFNNMESYEEGESIRMISTSQFYKRVTKEKNVEGGFINNTDAPSESRGEFSSSVKIKVFNRTGIYKRFYYDSINLNLGYIYPIGQQAEIVDSISQVYNKIKRATIFIHGVSYAGKSSIGYLLAKKFNGVYCHSFNPTDPGDQIGYVINSMSRSKEDNTPVIIVLEEANIIIKAVHTNSVKLNNDVPTSVHDKTSWINFLDDMKFYPEVILILTSNESKENIDALDPAYLQKGRINASYSMNSPLQLDDIS